MNRYIAEINNRSRGIAGQRAGGVRFGEVTSVDPATCAAKVRLQPEGVLSGWLPVLSPWIGAGWGASCPPVPGDQVAVAFQEGDNEHGVIIGRAYSDAQRSPGAPAGELWLVHQTGSTIRLLNSGDIIVTSTANAVVTVGGNATVTVTGDVVATAASFILTGDVQINGDLQVSGDILDRGGTKGSLQHIRDVYNTHTHGGGTQPDQKMLDL